MKLGEDIHKTQITRGSRVLVKTKYGGIARIREGRVIDAQRDCLKVEFRWWLFKWSAWLPIKDENTTLEFLTA